MERLLIPPSFRNATFVRSLVNANILVITYHGQTDTHDNGKGNGNHFFKALWFLNASIKCMVQWRVPKSNRPPIPSTKSILASLPKLGKLLVPTVRGFVPSFC